MYNINMGRDPESTVQDADIEMADLEASAARSSARAKRGICDHGWTQGKPDGTVVCLHCGHVFASQEEAYEAWDNRDNR
jgi:hypothetical protein